MKTGAARSLRWQLLGVTWAAVVLALLLAALLLAGLFRQHATAQFEQQLRHHLDDLTVRFDPAAPNGPSVQGDLNDPRWRTPYSGLYWQIERIGAGPASAGTKLRSRSLWDSALQLPTTAPTDGRLHRHQISGPSGQTLLALERSVYLSPVAGQPAEVWRLLVASQTDTLERAVQGFARQLGIYLLILGLALLLVAWAQATLGLRPLRQLQQALQALHSGNAQRLQGQFPAEVLPLVHDLNRVLEQNQQAAARAKRSAGDLAHAIKTPLAVLEQILHDPTHAVPEALQEPMRAQLSSIGHQLDWHLHRARLGSAALPGQRTPVLPVLEGLLRVMRKIYATPTAAGQALRWELLHDGSEPHFPGAEEDLQQAIGNLLDNAGKWATSAVRIRVQLAPDGTVQLSVEDDGPGLSSAQQQRALERGVRLDERQPGTGLGLDIVRDIMQLHGGQVQLQRSALGGLAATLVWPTEDGMVQT